MRTLQRVNSLTSPIVSNIQKTWIKIGHAPLHAGPIILLDKEQDMHSSAPSTVSGSKSGRLAEHWKERNIRLARMRGSQPTPRSRCTKVWPPKSGLRLLPLRSILLPSIYYVTRLLKPQFCFLFPHLKRRSWLLLCTLLWAPGLTSIWIIRIITMEDCIQMRGTNKDGST